MTNYDTLSEPEIVALAQKGDDKAFEYILDKYKDLVRAKTRAYFIIGAETEDLIQEGTFGLFKAVRDYDPQKNASFGGFAELCVRRQLISALKSATRQKHSPLNNSISLNKPVFEEDGDRTLLDMITSDVDDPEAMLISREKYNDIVAKINTLLSPLEKRVLFAYLNGMSYTEIASALETGEKSIDNALQRVKKKLERSLKNG